MGSKYTFLTRLEKQNYFNVLNHYDISYQHYHIYSSRKYPWWRLFIVLVFWRWNPTLLLSAEFHEIPENLFFRKILDNLFWYLSFHTYVSLVSLHKLRLVKTVLMKGRKILYIHRGELLKPFFFTVFFLFLCFLFDVLYHMLFVVNKYFSWFI